MSLLDAVRSGDTRTAREALGNLLEIYRPPLTEYLVRNRMLSQAEADDAFQGFIADKILEKDILTRFSSSVGKFRTFLLVSLRNYAEDCRRGRREITAGDASFADTPQLPPLDAFQVEFAGNVVQEVLHRIRSWYQDRNRPEVWELFKAVAVMPARDGAAVPDYPSLVEQLGFSSTSEAYNVLANAKRTANRILHNVVGEYETADVDEEISQIREILHDSATGLGAFLSGIQDESHPAAALEARLADIIDGDSGLTVGGLLESETPPIEILTKLKESARPGDDSADTTPLPVRETLYYGAIAAAFATYRKRITSLSDADLRRGFETILSRPWLTQPLRDLFQNALAALAE